MLFDHYLFFCSLCALQFFALFEWSNFLDSLLLLASALDDKNLLKKIGMWEPFDSFQPLGLKGLQQLQQTLSSPTTAAAEQKIQIEKSRFFNPTQAGNPSFYQHWGININSKTSKGKIPLKPFLIEMRFLCEHLCIYRNWTFKKIRCVVKQPHSRRIPISELPNMY